MGCPLGAELILLRPEKTQFSEDKDDSPAAALRGLEPDQLALMLDARRTMDIILQNRSFPSGRCGAGADLRAELAP